MSVLARTPIGDCVRSVGSWNPLRSAPDDEFIYIDLSAVDQERKQIADARRIRCREAPSRARQLLEAGDVLVSTVRPNLNGVACVSPEIAGATASTGFCVLRPRSEVLDSGYLFQWVRSPTFVADMVRKATGASYPAISDRIVHDSTLPLPALSVQRRITSILDQTDALSFKRREALRQLNSLTQSIFVEIFGDPVNNDRGWPTALVEELCTLVRGSSPRPQGDPTYFGGPVPRLMVADITRDGWSVTPRIDSLTLEGAKRSRPVSAGAVVMAVSGNIGLVSRLAIDACVHDGFVAFTSLKEDVCSPQYLLALLHFSKAVHEKNKAGAIFINLTTTDVKAMRLPLPPMRLQLAFVERMNLAKLLEDAHHRSLESLEALSSSLQHRAFRGEL